MSDVLEDKLHPRPQDEIPAAEHLARLALIGQLRKLPPFKKNPGATVLRRFARGEVVCRQGQAGNSAFYILTRGDLAALRASQLQAGAVVSEEEAGLTAQAIEQRRRRWQSELAETQQTSGATAEGAGGMPNSGENAAAAPMRQVAAAHLYLSDRSRPRTRSWFAALWGGGGERKESAAPEYVPNDGPQEIEYRTRQAPLLEGDVFGEMACLTQAPRSATVVATADCYMLEFLRNIFDHIHDDAGYRQRMDQVYRERVLANHLRRLEAFAQLSEAQLEQVRRRADLVFFEPGQVICDEGAPADCAYIIRKGMVQVLVDANVRLTEAEVLRPTDLCRGLLAAESGGGSSPPAAPKAAASAVPSEAVAKAETPTGKASAGKADPLSAMQGKAKAAVSPVAQLWNGLSSSVRQAVREAAEADQWTPERSAAIVEALNGMAASREFVSSEACASILERDDALLPVRVFSGGAKGAKKNWSEMEVRVGGRLLLEAMFPGCLARRAMGGPPRVVNYLSQGEIFGEMGVLIAPHVRTATCLAYDHPPEDLRARAGAVRRDSTRVELVKIGADVFQELIAQSPDLKRRVEGLIAERRARETQIKSHAAWAPGESVFGSAEFQRLGLIQGQKLLLVDLDRCTRCGDCVRACIATHDDGLSRLYLDGPRLDRFLIPSACRNCLDPACMIGCPVSSIQRGDGGQIEIRDWCIGCGKCAEQCPYDSIQMHDLGLLSVREGQVRASRDEPSGDGRWREIRFDDRDWQATGSPALLDYDLAVALGARSEQFAGAIRMRRRFNLAGRPPAGSRNVSLSVASEGTGLEVWLNGSPLQIEFAKTREKIGGRLTPLWRGDVWLGADELERGDNVLAVRAPGPHAYGKVLLTARIDLAPEGYDPPAATSGGEDAAANKKPAEDLRFYPDRAVVCDLCSSLPGQTPACVTMCPHEAAMRVDARLEFPRV